MKRSTRRSSRASLSARRTRSWRRSPRATSRCSTRSVLNNHNVGIHWILVSDKTYEKLSEEQAALLEQTIHEIRPENRTCVDDATEEILDEYRADSNYTVIEQDDIDMDAFIGKAEAYFEGFFTGESLAAYEALRELAD